MAGPSKNIHCSQKKIRDSCSPFVRATLQVYNETEMSINSTMDIEAPGMEFFIAILMPQSIGTTHTINSLFNDPGPPTLGAEQGFRRLKI